MDTRREVRTFIEGRLISKREVPRFGDGDNFFELGLVSSLFAMELVTHLEQTYSLRFADDDLDLTNFRSIDAIVQLLQRKLSPLTSSSSGAR